DGAADRGHRILAERPYHPPEAARGAPERVGGEDGASAEVQGIIQVLIEDSVEFAGPHAVGEQRGDHRSSAAADVHVEAAAFAVQPLFEGGQRADLVHAADDASTTQSQGETRARFTPEPAGLPEDRGASEERHIPAFRCSKALAIVTTPDDKALTSLTLCGIGKFCRHVEYD